MMFCTWVRSVFGAMNSRSQISGVERPSVSARRTSSSRGVSGSICRRSAGSIASRDHALGDAHDHGVGSSVSPAFAWRTALDDVLDGPVLGQIAVGAGLDRLEHRLVVLDGGEHHDPARGQRALMTRVASTPVPSGSR